MSLYNDASLVMIPSAYKDGKLYSIKPTDGSGDFTFSRGSNLAATRVDENGLIEKGRENLLLQSNQFDTTWAASVNITATSGQTGYDGTNDAWLLKRSSNASRFIYQNLSAGSSVYTLSFYGKPESEDWVYLYSFNGSGAITAYFDLQNGVVGTTSGSVISTNIEAAGNGYYRCSLTYNTSVSQVRIYPAVGNDSVTGGVSDAGIYIQDAQLEAGLVATDYIETTTTTAQAGILEDMPRLDYSGGASCPSLLLEPQRTNSLLYSEFLGGSYYTKYKCSIADNQGISPEGLNNAARITATGSGSCIIYETGIVCGSLSMFAKPDNIGSGKIEISVSGVGYAFWNADGTLDSSSGGTAVDGENYGNGWYRFAFNVTSGSVVSYGINGTSGDNMLIYGIQNEPSASYPTSYIPCYGAATTRSGDSAISPSNTFNSLSSFTWFFEIARTGFDIDMSGFALTLRTSAGAEQIRCHFDAPSQQIRIRDAVNGFATIGGTINVTENTYVKICVVSDGNIIKIFNDGAQRGSDYSIVTQHDVDRVYMQEKGFNCKQAAVFPTALTDSECIALTTL